MAVNLCVDTINFGNVSVSDKINTYIINVTSGITQIYNLPIPVSQGQNFTFLRIDGSNANISLRGTSTPLMVNDLNNGVRLLPYSITSVVYSGTSWYVVCADVISSTSIDAVFSAEFSKSPGVIYNTIVDSTLFLKFPFLGTSNYSTITSFLVTFGNAAIGLDGTFKLYKSNGTLICTANVPVSSNYLSYNLTAVEKDLLPTTSDILYVTYNGSVSIDVSSIIFYA